MNFFETFGFCLFWFFTGAFLARLYLLYNNMINDEDPEPEEPEKNLDGYTFDELMAMQQETDQRISRLKSRLLTTTEDGKHVPNYDILNEYIKDSFYSLKLCRTITQQEATRDIDNK